MTKRGPKPTPTALKRLAGNPGKRKLRRGEPRPGQAKVRKRRMPRGLSDGAKRLWRMLAGDLVELNLLTDVDVPAFMLMAEHFGIAKEAARVVADEGLQTIDEHKCKRKHPLLQVLRDNSTAFRMYATEFGLTPSCRARMNVQPEPEQLSLAEELFGLISEGEGSDEVRG